MDPQTIIAAGIARELRDGMLVNLGIGIPTLVANFVPPDIHVFFQSENDWSAPALRPRKACTPSPAHRRRRQAGHRAARARTDSAMSFGLIRGGHLDMTVLGARRSTAPVISPTG